MTATDLHYETDAIAGGRFISRGRSVLERVTPGVELEICRALSPEMAGTIRALLNINHAYSAVTEVAGELWRAERSFKPMNSAHEGYAVLMEEVEELWEHVKAHQSRRDYAAMDRECIQVAAMAVRFLLDVVRSPTRGHEKVVPQPKNCPACGADEGYPHTRACTQVR
jgi:hypothetical protein